MGEEVFSEVRSGLSSLSPALSVQEFVDGDNAKLRRDEFGHFAAGRPPSFVEADGELGSDGSSLSFRQQLKEVVVSVADVRRWSLLG